MTQIGEHSHRGQGKERRAKYEVTRRRGEERREGIKEFVHR